MRNHKSSSTSTEIYFSRWTICSAIYLLATHPTHVSDILELSKLSSYIHYDLTISFWLAISAKIPAHVVKHVKVHILCVSSCFFCIIGSGPSQSIEPRWQNIPETDGSGVVTKNKNIPQDLRPKRRKLKKIKHTQFIHLSKTATSSSDGETVRF